MNGINLCFYITGSNIILAVKLANLVFFVYFLERARLSLFYFSNNWAFKCCIDKWQWCTNLV